MYLFAHLFLLVIYLHKASKDVPKNYILNYYELHYTRQKQHYVEKQQKCLCNASGWSNIKLGNLSKEC